MLVTILHWSNPANSTHALHLVRSSSGLTCFYYRYRGQSCHLTLHEFNVILILAELDVSIAQDANGIKYLMVICRDRNPSKS